jgi:hypothetical protein
VHKASKTQDDRNNSCEEYVGISIVTPSDAYIFYTFLCTRTVVQVRASLRALGEPQKGEMSALALRVFVKMAKVVGEGGDWVKECGPQYEEWLCSPESQLATWKVAPCAAEYSSVALRTRDSTAISTEFSVSDFERMCYILTQD